MVEEDLRAFNVERLYATDKSVTPISVVEAARTLPMLRLAPHRDRAGGRKAAGAEEEGRRRRGRPGWRGRRAAHRLLRLAVARDDADSSCSRPAKRPTRFRCRRTCGSPRQWPPPRPSSPAAAWTAARTRHAGFRSARRRQDWRSTGRPWRSSSTSPAAIPGGCARTSRSCCCLRRAAGRSCSTTCAPLPARRCTTATTGRSCARWSSRTPATALRELQASLNEDVSPFLILGQIAGSVRSPRSRYSPRRIPAAVDAIFRTDQAMKSSGGDPKVLLERLIVEMCG